jgi:hypothetical protein
VFTVRYELRSYVPEDGILHSHGREHLKSYILHCSAALSLFSPSRYIPILEMQNVAANSWYRSPDGHNISSLLSVHLLVSRIILLPLSPKGKSF